MYNVDQFVDAVYDELEKLYTKDKNYQKRLLGNTPMKKIFDNYADWLAYNSGLSPKVAANAIYKDVIRVGYIDFVNKGLKKNVQLKGETGFSLIFGNAKEIDYGYKLMTDLKNKDQAKYNLVLTALEKVKQISDTVKPAKNIFGKTTNVAKQDIQQFKLPKLTTLQTFLKMNNNQLSQYIKQLDASIAANQRVSDKKVADKQAAKAHKQQQSNLNQPQQTP